MRIVDISTLPDRSEGRAELDRALDEVDLGMAQRTEPIDPTAAFGLGFPQDSADDALRAQAAQIREDLEELVSEDFSIRFELADAEAGEGGAPTHVE